VLSSIFLTPTPCHHLSMQVSVLLNIFSTYNCCINYAYVTFLFSCCFYCQLQMQSCKRHLTAKNHCQTAKFRQFHVIPRFSRKWEPYKHASYVITYRLTINEGGTVQNSTIIQLCVVLAHATACEPRKL